MLRSSKTGGSTTALGVADDGNGLDMEIVDSIGEDGPGRVVRKMELAKNEIGAERLGRDPPTKKRPMTLLGDIAVNEDITRPR